MKDRGLVNAARGELDVQGHRGARGLFPENTLEGFRATAALGVAAFELDVGMTRDGVVVVSHDLALNPDLTRGPDGAWLGAAGPLIREVRWVDLLRYDVGRVRPESWVAGTFPDQQAIDGARVPRLADVLAALPDCRFTIEVKTDPRHPDWTMAPELLAEAVLAVVDQADAAERVMIEAFEWRVQRHVRLVRPEIRLAWLTRPETVRDAGLWLAPEAGGVSVPERVAAEGGPVWAPDYADLTEAEVRTAHALGLSVLPWTVNRVEDMRRLLDWGVDGLISDRPDLALGVTGAAASDA